eukprot:38430-Amphidinium_carterae.1
MAPKKAAAKSSSSSTLTPAKRKAPSSAIEQVHAASKSSKSSIKAPQRRADLSIANAVRAAIRDNLRGWSRFLIYEKVVEGDWEYRELIGHLAKDFHGKPSMIASTDETGRGSRQVARWCTLVEAT